MGLHSIDFARSKGYHGIQFNLVVSTNTPAIRLWKKLGWETVGRIPGGFRHLTLGFVDTLVMSREVQGENQNGKIPPLGGHGVKPEYFSFISFHFSTRHVFPNSHTSFSWLMNLRYQGFAS